MSYLSKSNIDVLPNSNFSDIFRVLIKRSKEAKIISFWGQEKEACMLAEVGHVWMYT